MTSVATEIRDRLDNDGWSTVVLPHDADLRTVVPLLKPNLTAHDLDRIEVERISPKTSDQARAGTLSASYGLGPFPLHTERAHWPRPPRHVVFRSVGAATARPTTFVDSHRLANQVHLVQRLATVPWRVAWGATAFDACVLTTTSAGRPRFRFDPCCMTICDRKHIDLVAELAQGLDRLPVEAHEWKPDIVLILDNWRILHGRGASPTADFGRILERIVVP